MRGKSLARSSLAMACCVILGCASTPKKTPMAVSGPVVNPTQRELDNSALAESNRDLAQAHWAILEQHGPHARGLPKDDTPFLVDGSSKHQLTATTQPLNEADLPLTIVHQPDGKLKLIWVLRSYGGNSVTAKANADRRDITLTKPDLTPLVTVLTQEVGKDGSVVPLPEVNTVVVTCDAAMKQSVLQTLNDLDQPPKQVEITAKIFEVTNDFDYQQGAQIMAARAGANQAQAGSSTFDTNRFLQDVANPSSGPFQGSVVSLMQASTDAGLSINASFQLLEEVGLIKVVSSPRMTVAVGQTGYMLAGQEIPIQSTTIINGAIQASTIYKPVGVQLYITPQAVGDNMVKLHTISVVSSISGFAPLPTLIGGTSPNSLVNPVIDSREAETAVTIADGSTLVISGLRMVRTTTVDNKVPGLGDVPLLGDLFKSHRTQQTMTDLYFFVTPNIL